MSGYILTPFAQQDLADVRDYYLEEAGYRVARQMLVEFVETFRFLASTPGAGHKREEEAGTYPALSANAGFERCSGLATSMEI